MLMSLPTSGALHLAQIGYEAGKPLMLQVDMDDPEVRKLCNKLAAGSQISVQDFYGTAYGVGPGYGAQQFTDITGAGLAVYVVTETIYLHDAPVGGAAMALQSTAADASYSINGGAWTDKSVLGMVKRSDSITLRILTSTQQQTSVSAQVVYNGLAKSVTITTATVVTGKYVVYASTQYRSAGGKSANWYVGPYSSTTTYDYGGVYTFGTQLPSLPFVLDGNLKPEGDPTVYYTIASLFNDVLYVNFGVNLSTPTATRAVSRSSGSTMDPTYMGVTAPIVATGSLTAGFKMVWG